MKYLGKQPSMAGLSEEERKARIAEIIDYPEHAKLKAVQDRSQAIGEFLDWLSVEKQTELAFRHEHDKGCRNGLGFNECGYRNGDFVRVGSTKKLIAEFFEIDEKKLENEKLVMLVRLRATPE